MIKTNRVLDVILLVVATILCLAMLEWLLRVFVFNPNASYIRTPGWGMIVRTNDLLPHVSKDHVLTVNSLGIRGAMPAYGASPKIAVLGGSTAEDWVLAEPETWAQQLAMQLRDCAPNVWVANLGKGGVNARHHLLQLPEVEKYMPRYDLFVVLLGLNDFLYDLHIHHPFQTPEDWWRRQAFMSLPGDEGKFALVAITKRLYAKFFAAPAANAATSDFGNYQKHLRDAYAKVSPENWVDTMPDLTGHLARFQRTIRSLKAYADSYGAPILFVTQPYVWSGAMSDATQKQLFAGFIGADINSPLTKWYTPSALEKGLSAYNAATRSVCKSDGLLCIDAAAELPQEAPYYYDDFHFSSLGAAKIGEIVARQSRPHLKGCR
jgi:lysophospholipase L1-like esterase